MRSHTTARFRQALSHLPERVRRQASQAYRLFQQHPDHPGLHFKPVHSTRPIYSAGVSDDYRAVGVMDGDEIVWFWIGTHADYDHLIAQL